MHRVIPDTRRKTKENTLLILIITVIVFMCSSCSHSLNVKNLQTYRTLALEYVEQATILGVSTNTTDSIKGVYIRSICKSLQQSSYASRVLFPYNFSLHINNPKADILVSISPSTNYAGSGWNFLINWPGFLIFAPAWNGYIYTADLNFQITLTDGKTGVQIDNFDVPITYDVRHAAMNRTWTVGVGWCEWGVTPLIAGFFFTGYDDTVTELLLYKTKEDVGNYVAEKIVARINNYVYMKK